MTSFELNTDLQDISVGEKIDRVRISGRGHVDTYGIAEAIIPEDSVLDTADTDVYAVTTPTRVIDAAKADTPNCGEDITADTAIALVGIENGEATLGLVINGFEAEPQPSFFSTVLTRVMKESDVTRVTFTPETVDLGEDELGKIGAKQTEDGVYEFVRSTAPEFVSRPSTKPHLEMAPALPALDREPIAA